MNIATAWLLHVPSLSGSHRVPWVRARRARGALEPHAHYPPLHKLPPRGYFITANNKEDERWSPRLSLHCLRDQDRTSITEQKSHISFSQRKGGDGQRDECALSMVSIGIKKAAPQLILTNAAES